MKWGFIKWTSLLTLPLLTIIFSACSPSSSSVYNKDRSSASSPYGATAARGQGYRPVPATPAKTPSQLYKEANVKQDIIPRGRHARKYRRAMRPRYITIHSTQNYSSSADAWRHSLALKNGKLRARKRKGGNRIGYLVWHFTIDQHRAVQHLPTNEQGEHADFDGPGNNYSIGLEMCENRGNSRSATIERTAKLAAYLMHKYKIPLRKVVPHYHWPRKGLSKPHKNCPHYLLDNGHPGAKWQWFLAKVNKHYKSITTPSRSSSPYATPVATAVSTQRTVSAPPRARTTAPAPRAAKPKPRPAPKPKTRYHTVRRGDTLYGIARKYKTSVTALKSRNGLRSNTIGIGKRLRLP
ncbi:MAG: N-acetylmuramoyl-L-alanine amidase [Akkermansiaceae bacterium]